MKTFKLYSVLFALVFSFTELRVLAATRSEQLRKDSATLIYSLKNVQNGLVPKDIQELDKQAGGYLSVQLAAEIAERISASIDLIHEIKRSDLSSKEKADMIDSVGSELGALFMTSVRHHGDDELDPKLNKDPIFVQYGKKATLELINTVKDLFHFPATIDGNSHIWKIKERMYREYISQTAVIKFQKLMSELGQNPNDPDFKALKFLLAVPDSKKEHENDLGNVEKALLVRQNRLSAHYTVLGTIGFGAFMWTLFPVDWAGIMVGYDMVTPRISDFITYSTFTLLALIRQATGAFGTIPGLKRLIEIIKDPSKTDVFSTLKLPLFAKIMRIEKKVEAERKKFNPNSCTLF
ncbi:MAG: hypothetical protein A4S09_00200 [Proteobacteria bacterium SG_bin7]|nr:MAG: hypothetical protein A4S09_00200 [Proteobacteria bacterium SG_bin7]